MRRCATARIRPSTSRSRIGIVSGGTIDTGANNVTFGTALANANGGTGGLNKIGTGTLTLNKQNTYAGPTGVTQGTLLLDLTGVNNVISPTSAGLLLGGGNLSVKAPGAAAVASQTLSSTTFASGGSTITPILTAAPTTGTLTLALGTLNRNAGATGNIVFDTTTNKVTAASTQITQSTTGGAAPTLITSPLGSAYLTFGTTAASVKDWAVIAAGSNADRAGPRQLLYSGHRDDPLRQCGRRDSELRRRRSRERSATTPSRAFACRAPPPPP